MKSFELKVDDIIEVMTPLRNKEEYIKVSKIEHSEPDIKNTEKDMVDFLKKHHSSSNNMIGFELRYNPKIGTGMSEMYLIAQKEESKEISETFSNHHKEDGNIQPSENYNLELEKDEWFNVKEYKLKNDYWYPLQYYNDIDLSKDPLDIIINKMEADNKNTKFNFQIILEPIEDKKWKKRMSIPYVLGGLTKETSKMIYNLSKGIYNGAMTLIDLFKMMLRNRNSFKTDLKNTIRYMKKAFKNLKNNYYWLKGMTYEEYEKRFLDKNENFKRMEDKIDQKGYVANIRLLTVGNNKKEVERKSDIVSDEIQDVFSVEYETFDLTQGLKSNYKEKKAWQIQKLKDLYSKKSGMNRKDEVIEKHPLNKFKLKRNQPVIITPEEISSMIHYITEDRENLN